MRRRGLRTKGDIKMQFKFYAPLAGAILVVGTSASAQTATVLAPAGQIATLTRSRQRPA